LGIANSGLFARTKRIEKPKRASNKQKSITRPISGKIQTAFDIHY
jgi:hypothetical protein